MSNCCSKSNQNQQKLKRHRCPENDKNYGEVPYKTLLLHVKEPWNLALIEARIESLFMTDKHLHIPLFVKTHDVIGLPFIASLHARCANWHVGHGNTFYIWTKQQ